MNVRNNRVETAQLFKNSSPSIQNQTERIRYYVKKLEIGADIFLRSNF